MCIGKAAEGGRQHHAYLAEMAEHQGGKKGDAGHGQRDNQRQLEVERSADFDRLVSLGRGRGKHQA